MEINAHLRTPSAVQPETGLKSGRREELSRASEALEEQFLGEMLRHSGLARPQDTFGGGAGEAAFADFLIDAHARDLMSRGGIGLAESIFRALIAKEEQP